MAVSLKKMIPAKLVENAQTTQYTAAGVQGIIDKFVAMNVSGAAATLTVNLVASGDAASNANKVVSKTLQAGETYTFPEVVGQVVANGGFISTIASAANAISLQASGREVS